jgi:hypothetical protein
MQKLNTLGPHMCIHLKEQFFNKINETMMNAETNICPKAIFSAIYIFCVAWKNNYLKKDAM